MSHLIKDLNCLPFSSRFLTGIHICNSGCVQIQRQKSPLQKLRDERIIFFILLHQNFMGSDITLDKTCIQINYISYFSIKMHVVGTPYRCLS